MKFTYYKKNDLKNFETKIKDLALEKNYKFEKREETLDKDKILGNSNETFANSTGRELLKLLDDKAKVNAYLLKHRKHNYLIFVGEPLGKDIIGIYINFNNKPFKQVGKGLLGLPLIVFGGPVGLIAAVGVTLSSVRRMTTIKGPLSKPLSEIMIETLGEPIE